MPDTGCPPSWQEQTWTRGIGERKAQPKLEMIGHERESTNPSRTQSCSGTGREAGSVRFEETVFFLHRNMQHLAM